MAQVIGLFSGTAQKRFKGDWTNNELAEFYRVQSTLIQGGLEVEAERGLTDEGDPWFVFCHRDSGDIIVHFARIDGEYIVASPALPQMLTGVDLKATVRQFVSDGPASLLKAGSTCQDKVLLHPSALLTVFVATILFMEKPGTGFAAAAADGADVAADKGNVFAEPGEEKIGRAGETILFLAAVALAVEAVRLENQDGSEFDAEASLIRHRVHWAELSEDPEVAWNESKTFDLYELPKTSSSVDGGRGAVQAVVLDPEAAGGGSAVTLEFSSTSPEDNVIQFSNEVLGQEVLSLTPDHGSGLQEAHIGTGQNVSISLTNLSDVIKVEIGSPDGDQTDDVSSAARNWLNEQAVTSGWELVILDMASAPNLAQAIELGHPLVEELANFDESARRAIEHFWESDNDIAVLKGEDGSYIMFDRSDLVEGKQLSLQSWEFDDQTSLTILGHADTVAESIPLTG